MNVTVIPIVISALGTMPKRVFKGLKVLEIRGQVEIIQTLTLLKSGKILRIVKVGETCRHSNSSEKPFANTGVKNTQKSNSSEILTYKRIT